MGSSSKPRCCRAHKGPYMVSKTKSLPEVIPLKPSVAFCQRHPNTDSSSLPFAVSLFLSQKLYISLSITARKHLGYPLLFPAAVRNGLCDSLNQRKDLNDKSGNSSRNSLFFHFVQQSQTRCTSAALGRTGKSSYKGMEVR